MGQILISICALVVALGLGAAQQRQPEQSPRPNPAPANDQRSPGQDNEAALPRIASALETYLQRQDPKTDSENTQRDLKAQEDTAFWAMCMAIASVATVGISGWGVVLIYRTLKETRLAAQAASEGVRDLRAQTRARLRIEVVYGNLVAVDPRDQDEQTLWISVTLANIGNTAASEIKVSAEAEYEDQSFAIEDMFSSVGDPHAMIAERSNATWNQQIEPLVFRMSAMREGAYANRLMWIKTLVRYQDIYGEQHVVESRNVGSIMAVSYLPGEKRQFVNAHFTPAR